MGFYQKVCLLRDELERLNIFRVEIQRVLHR